MKSKFALVILSTDISVKRFEHKDDFDTARQTLVTGGKKCVPLRWHEGAGIWVQPEVHE